MPCRRQCPFFGLLLHPYKCHQHPGLPEAAKGHLMAVVPGAHPCPSCQAPRPPSITSSQKAPRSLQTAGNRVLVFTSLLCPSSSAHQELLPLRSSDREATQQPTHLIQLEKSVLTSSLLLLTKAGCRHAPSPASRCCAPKQVTPTGLDPEPCFPRGGSATKAHAQSRGTAKWNAPR